MSEGTIVVGLLSTKMGACIRCYRRADTRPRDGWLWVLTPSDPFALLACFHGMPLSIHIVSPDCHWALGSGWSRCWPRRGMNDLLRALAFHGKTPSVLAFVHLKSFQACCFMSTRVCRRHLEVNDVKYDGISQTRDV